MDVDENENDLAPMTRVGEQFQAQIPSRVSISQYVAESRVLVGLPVDVMWINEEDDDLRSLVPGSTSSIWSEDEQGGFVLGLYLFGKSLRQIAKLLQSKTMEEVHVFYYGKFYRSLRHKRWSEGCRARTRRCVFGQKLVAGWRHHELLSRLLSRSSQQHRPAIEEAFQSYLEGKTGFETLVNVARSFVGLAGLVWAVGIGRGKGDLTSAATGPARAHQAHEMKVMNALTTPEVVGFLTGGLRLSKARAHELFWEAIWPRLLGRGWHSERPRNYSDSLVFLIPGVQKFSKTKLVKGDHFFDSIADILDKVASDPSLIHVPGGVPEEGGQERGDGGELEKRIVRSWLDLNAPPEEEEGSGIAETTPCEESAGERRHGTRKRPPTARALEALAAGYLSATSKRKWKGCR